MSIHIAARRCCSLALTYQYNIWNDDIYGVSKPQWVKGCSYTPDAPVLATVELTVYTSPDRGLSATLTCLISGYPPRDGITWDKDHKPLDIAANPRISMEIKDLEARTQLEVSLTIMAVSELPGTNDFGTYSCHAASSLGSETADIVLASKCSTLSTPCNKFSLNLLSKIIHSSSVRVIYRVSFFVLFVKF